MERSEISNTVAQPGTVSTSQNAALTEEQLRLKFSTELSLSFSPGKASESSASTAMRPVVSVSEPASKPVPSVAAVHMTPAPKASPPAVVPAASVALAAPAPVAALPAKVRESVAATAPAPSQAASASAITAASPAASVADDWAKAQVLVRAGSNDEAEVLLRKVLDSQPALVAPRQALVGLLLGARRFSEAIPVLKVGVQRLPQQTAWSMNLARLHVDAGDYPAAWEALATGLPHAQQQADYLAFAGTVLQRIARPVDAATQYQAALRLRPEEARWWVGLGIALDASGHSVEAKTAFRRAKALGGYSADMGRYIDQKLQ